MILLSDKFSMSAAPKQNIQDKDEEKKETSSGGADVIKLEFSVYRELEAEGPITVSEDSNDSEVAKVHHLPTANMAVNGHRGEIDTLEAQVKLIALFGSEAKLLEAEMNKLIKGAYSKAPEAKPYFLKMKKLLQLHADIEKILEKAKEVK